MKKLLNKTIALIAAAATALTMTATSFAAGSKSFDDIVNGGWGEEIIKYCYCGTSVSDICKGYDIDEATFGQIMQYYIDLGYITKSEINEMMGINIDDYINFAVDSTNVADFKIAELADAAYTGKAIKPAITITNGKTTLKKGTDYTVTYKNNKSIGKATVTVKGKGKYTGTVTLNFNIVPKKTAIATIKATQSTNKVKLTWKKNKNATGYEVYYSTSKTGEFTLLKTITKNTTLKFTTKALDEGYTYYFKIRAYKTVNKVKYYSDYSTMKTAKLTSPDGKEFVDIFDCDESISNPYLTIADEVAGNVHLKWTGGGRKGDKIQVLRSTEWGNMFEVVTTITNDSDYSYDGYIDVGAAGKGYIYGVRIIKDGIISSTSGNQAEVSKCAWYKDEMGYIRAEFDYNDPTVLVGFYEFNPDGYVLWNCDWGFMPLEGDFFDYELSAPYGYGYDETYEGSDEIPPTFFVKINDKEFVLGTKVRNDNGEEVIGYQNYTAIK